MLFDYVIIIMHLQITKCLFLKKKFLPFSDIKNICRTTKYSNTLYIEPLKYINKIQRFLKCNLWVIFKKKYSLGS